MANATKGPWHVEHNQRTVGVYSADNPGERGVRICFCSISSPKAAGCAEANARLIANAPTMYSFILDKAQNGDSDAKAIIASIDNAAAERARRSEQMRKMRAAQRC